VRQRQKDKNSETNVGMKKKEDGSATDWCS